jgi:hypothetical protein
MEDDDFIDLKDDKEKKHAHKKHEAKYMEHNQHKKMSNYKTSSWAFGIIAAVLAVVLIVSIVTHGFSSKGALSEDQVKASTIAYLNNLLGSRGQTATVDSITDKGDLYQMKLNIGGQTFDSYVTKDGRLLFPQALDLTQKANAGTAASAQAPQQTDVPKTAKPTVELFVMSYCPFGTQAEKGMLPAVRALGDKIDFKVRFVYYAMHGKKEVDENLRQYCIREEQPDKYDAYLACFLNASDSPGCLASTGVDTKKLDACVAASDTKFDVTKNWNDQSSWLSGQFPLFNTDKDLNTKYSVGGSPTLIINGVQSNAGRDSASYLSAICNAFTDKPSECNTQLSAVSPGPGFGYDSVGSAQAAGCGV